MKLRYKILTIAVALIGLCSCNDFLEKVPDTRVYLVNLEQLEQLLVTGYTEYNYALVAEFSSDNIVDNNAAGGEFSMRYNLASYSKADEQIFAWQDVDVDISSADCPSGVWKGCYGAIAVANAVLEKVDEFEEAGEIEGEPITVQDQARIDAIKGEAYLIRAYHHYILAQMFCMPYRGPEISKTLPGIPYATKPETTLNPQYDRGTLQETYDKIEADLLQGLKYVNDEFYKVPKYHFNVSAANSFAARFYTVKREYEKVVEYATAAFKGQDPATMRNDIWDAASDIYSPYDAARYYSSVERPGNFMMFTTYSVYSRRYLGYRFSCNHDALRATIMGPGPSWKNCKWSYRSGKNTITFSMMPCFYSLSPSVGLDYGAFFAGSCLEQFEYLDKLAGSGYPHMIRTEFTSQETLLLRAEAYIFLHRIPEAFADLAMWCDEHLMTGEKASDNGRMTNLTEAQILNFYSYYGDPDTLRVDPGYGIVKQFHIDEVCPSDKYKLTRDIEPYLQCVQHFRRIQMVQMGNRWFDIKRYGFSIQHKMGTDALYTLEVLDPRYAIQIPSEVIGAGLEPNPRTPVSEDNTLNNTSRTRIVREN